MAAKKYRDEAKLIMLWRWRFTLEEIGKFLAEPVEAYDKDGNRLKRVNRALSKARVQQIMDEIIKVKVDEDKVKAAGKVSY